MRWCGEQPVSMLVLMVLVLAAAACGEDTPGGGSAQPQGTELQVTLGTKDFTEQFLIGELYEQALAARGYKVTLRKDIGSTEVIDTQLTADRSTPIRSTWALRSPSLRAKPTPEAAPRRPTG
jgi:glycine betaine/choline ABC-type transport system substrate-binding protein